MKRLVVWMALSALALGCGDSTSSSQAVELSFAAVVGDQPFVCGETYDDLGANGTPLVLSDFRFYVQEIQLKNGDGGWVPVQLNENKFQNDNVALLDFEDGCGEVGNEDMNDRVLGTVPAGQYDGIRFKMGVPFAMNHMNHATASSPLNILPCSGTGRVATSSFESTRASSAKPTGACTSAAPAVKATRKQAE